MNASTDFFTLINAANASPEKPLNIGEFEEAWPPI